MTATGHAIIGVALAAMISNPLIGIPVAIISHIPCDLFPHWDSGTAKRMGRKKSKQRFTSEAVVDVVISFVVTYFISTLFFLHLNLFYAFAMAIAAQGFDYLSIPYYVLNFKFWPFSMVNAWQSAWNITLDAPWGIINQFAAGIFLLILAKLY